MFEDAEIISSYSRAEALSDGALVDVTETAKEAGFLFPVAVTQAVWLDCVSWGASEKASKPRALQDESGRLWDVVYLAFNSARQAGGMSRITYTVYRVPTEGRGLKARPVNLVLHIGPGDAGEPVITIMQPHED
jgi:hypothetical protein